jgi:hypothetical protein
VETSKDWSPEYTPPSILPERFKKGQFLRKASCVSPAMILKVRVRLWCAGQSFVHVFSNEQVVSEGRGCGKAGLGGQVACCALTPSKGPVPAQGLVCEPCHDFEGESRVDGWEFGF